MARGIKHAVAAALDATGLNDVLLRAQAALFFPHARALNYHDVPPSQAGAFEDQLRFYTRHFTPMGYAELLELHAGRWPHAKPGLMLTFDDGVRSHAEVAAPLLEKHGFTGWFMVPIGFVETPVADQAAFAKANRIPYDASEVPDARVAVSLEQLRELDARHVICCHSHSHRRLGDDLSETELQQEIGGAGRRLEEILGHEVPGFAWVGGEESSYSAAAARVIRDSNYAVSFMTCTGLIRPGCDLLQLQRTNIEAGFEPAMMRLSLSGFFDVYHAAKRRRVNRLTAAPH